MTPGDHRAQRRRRGRILDRIVTLRAQDNRPPEKDQPAEAGLDEIEVLRRRIEHLEAALEGLQDAVHRENSRREAQIQELQRQTSPGAMAQSLEADARRRRL